MCSLRTLCAVFDKVQQMKKKLKTEPFSLFDEFLGRSIQAGQQTGQLYVHMRAAQAKWPRSIPAATPAETYWSSYRHIFR